MDMPQDNTLYDRSLVKIRFVGDGLEKQGIPIYELGQSFIAFQRIINKAYLFKQGRLGAGGKLTPVESKKCALQILARKRESDAYGLTSILTDPIYGDILKSLIVVGVTAIGAYVKKIVFPSDKGKLPENQPLVGAINNEVNVFVDRIGNIGGANSIQISAGGDLKFETLNIDKSTQEYVRNIHYEPFLGEVTTIEGVVTRIHPRRMSVDIRDTPKHYITVHLDETNFNKIRRSTKITNYMRFEGRPIYLQGLDTGAIREFEAHKVSITKMESE